MDIEVPIRTETIALDQVLKLADAVESGGHAKVLIQDGLVSVNGEVETRRRKQLSAGDVVSIEEGPTIGVIAAAGGD